MQTTLASKTKNEIQNCREQTKTGYTKHKNVHQPLGMRKKKIG
jgi:hypothetical protein